MSNKRLSFAYQHTRKSYTLKLILVPTNKNRPSKTAVNF
jgi:hypothetical protein